MTFKISRRQATLGLAGLALGAGHATGAKATLNLKWAHVYETGEPFHEQALWAAGEILQRSRGEVSIEVFPSGQLGSETQINDGLGLGTIDIIYTGVAFAGAVHPPLAISNAPFILRDYDHWNDYRASDLFRTIATDYDRKTGNKVAGLTYYGQRHVTANRVIRVPEDMRGMKLRVPPAPLFQMFTRSVGAIATPVAFSEVYQALKQGTVDGQENPLPTIKAKKFYEVQSHIMLTAHITESTLTIIGGHVWGLLSSSQKAIVEEVMEQAAFRASEQIRAAEGRLAAEFRDMGEQVIEIDRQPFMAAAVPLHNDPTAGAGWSRGEYDALEALGG